MRRFIVRTAFMMFVVLQFQAYCQTVLPRFSGHDLRTIADTTVTPQFPPEAIKAHQTGVAVALVTVSDRGSVSKVEILEAPSTLIGTSVSDALAQWHFKTASSNGRSTGYTGKVTYYFVFQNGQAAVLSPEEAPYIGRWSAKAH